jgi:KDO2-lipid IV(A) lauroyltransferase
VKVALLKALAWLFSLVHPRIAHLLARPIAAVLWLVARRLRTVSLRNLELCLPGLDEKQRLALARSAMIHYVRNIFETGMGWYWSPQRLQALFLPAIGEEHVEAARALGRGVIALSPHIGAWELITISCAADIDGCVLYKPGDDPALNQAILEKRQKAGIRLVPATPAGLRVLVGDLRQGKIIGALPDQEPRDGDGVFAPFFGVPALTGVLIPRLAARLGAAVVYCVCLRRPGGRDQIRFLPVDEAIRSPDRVVAASELNRGVERCIGLDPAQYLWAYKRFRARPEGEKPVY